jgi:hypothetical protein
MWVETMTEGKLLERSRTAEENAAAKVAALEAAHAKKLAELQRAQDEAMGNEAALVKFYQKHNPEHVSSVKAVLNAYKLEQIVGLSMVRYGEAPTFRSGGKVVRAHVTEEMQEVQKAKQKREEAAAKGARAAAKDARDVQEQRIAKKEAAEKAAEQEHLQKEQRLREEAAEAKRLLQETELALKEERDTLLAMKETEHEIALARTLEDHEQALKVMAQESERVQTTAEKELAALKKAKEEADRRAQDDAEVALRARAQAQRSAAQAEKAYELKLQREQREHEAKLSTMEVALEKAKIKAKDAAEIGLAEKAKADEDALEQVRRLESAHSRKIAELQLAQQEARYNQEILTRFYQKHNPTRVGDVAAVLKHYSLEQIVGLSMARYGEGPAFRSGGDTVRALVTKEMHAVQEHKLKREQEEKQAEEQRLADEKAAEVELERQRLQKEVELRHEASEATRRLKETQAIAEEETRKKNKAVQDSVAKVRELEVEHAKKIAELEQAQDDLRHNTAELTAFYTKHNPARVTEVHTVLMNYKLTTLAEVSMTRYGEAPEFRSGGQPLNLEAFLPAEQEKGKVVAVEAVDALKVGTKPLDRLMKKATAAGKRSEENVVAKMMAQAAAKKEAVRNEGALRAFYEVHNPGAVDNVHGVLAHYSLVHIVALSKMRYGAAPKFVHNGRPVVESEVSAEMKMAQEKKRQREEEEAKAADDAVAKASKKRVEKRVAEAQEAVRKQRAGSERAVAASPAAQRLTAQKQDATRAAKERKAKAQEMQQKAQELLAKQQTAGVLSDDDGGVFSDDGGVFSDDGIFSEDEEEKKAEKVAKEDEKERYCNKMELAQFYREHNPNHRKKVAAILEAYSLEQIAGHTKKRYG